MQSPQDIDNNLSGALIDLESLRARLQVLCLAARSPGHTGPLIEKVLANPSCHKRLLERLATHGNDTRTILIEIARAAADDITADDPDNGYPPDDGPSDERDGGGGLSDVEEDEDDDESEEVSSDTDADDKLSDEDLEDAFMEIPTHEERQSLRAMVRSDGQMPPYVDARLKEIRADRDYCDDRALKEDEDDAAAEEEAMREWVDEALYDAQAILDSMRHGGDGNEDMVLSDTDIDDILGFAVSPGAVTEARNPPDNGVRDARKELDAVESAIEELEDAEENRQELVHEIRDAVALYRIVREISDTDPDGSFGPYTTLCDSVDEADYEDLPTSTSHLQRVLQDLRAGVDKAKSVAVTVSPRVWKDFEALREIEREQRKVASIIDLRDFGRLAREVVQDASYSGDMQIEPEAIEALRAASEGYLVGLLGDAGLAAIHAGRTYLAPQDMQFVRRVRRVRN